MADPAPEPAEPIVPDGFAVPETLVTEEFRLEPLHPRHNVSDHAAWSSSIEHIRATPGWAGKDWPYAMPLDENLADLERHFQEYEERVAFAYTVLGIGRESGDEDEVIGCVYVCRGPAPGVAKVSSWVRADRAELDAVLHRAVSGWLARDWPFTSVEYAARS